VGLLEADLTDYAGMYVGGVAGVENALLSKLSPTRDRMDQVVIGSTPKSTPWRVLLINSRPGALIESNYIILDLSAPCALTDTSWIQPGKAAWDWWSGSFAKPACAELIPIFSLAKVSWARSTASGASASLRSTT
jgi:alpha-glucosidase